MPEIGFMIEIAFEKCHTLMFVLYLFFMNLPAPNKQYNSQWYLKVFRNAHVFARLIVIYIDITFPIMLIPFSFFLRHRKCVLLVFIYLNEAAFFTLSFANIYRNWCFYCNFFLELNVMKYVNRLNISFVSSGSESQLVMKVM